MVNAPDASGSGNAPTPLLRMHSANFTALARIVDAPVAPLPAVAAVAAAWLPEVLPQPAPIATIARAAPAHVLRLTAGPRSLCQEMAARVRRGVEDGHAARLVGGRDAIRIDERLTVDGIRKVRHTVRTDTLGELERRRELRLGQVRAQRSRWLQGLACSDGLRPHSCGHADPVGRELARR